MNLRDLPGRTRLPASRFCCDCGEQVRPEIRPRWGGHRCLGCRAVAGARPRLVAALAATICGAMGYVIGHAPARSPGPPIVVTSTVQAPADAGQPPRPVATLHPCGALTKRGTRCKRLVHGDGFCWQHAKRK